MTEGTRSLSDGDRLVLERLLTNEADMAFRRRVPILLDYLELTDDVDVLDCGCGMGFYLMAIRELRPSARLTGVDPDAERLRFLEDLGVSARAVVGDARALPFEDESFDSVLMSEVLEHLRDDDAGLREALRVLRPGGVLAISVPHARYPFWWDPINATWIGLGGRPIRSGPIAGIWSNHERLYEPEQLESRVRSAGFYVEDSRKATHYSVPFIHFLVYGIGKPLIEKDLLPSGMRSSADRFSGMENSSSPLNPFNAARSLFRAVDRLNDGPRAAGKRTFVNVLLKARKPGQPTAG
ncbi:MAG TPA: class I SAM-dependent methyltransferase [Gaiellaceae bacterium]|nr:class I SAM-dependent methyltransferase [Gaiellaceae bacterium]